MSMFGKYDERPGFFMSCCFKVVKSGKIPQHVAFIMDGNRRYTKLQGLPQKEGYTQGFTKLTEVLQWCYELGIPEVTVYAFSIENFKRSQDEVDALMTIFKEKIERLLLEKENIMKYGVCIRFIGDITMFSEDIQIAMAKVVSMSRNNKNLFFNIAMAYTSREEISRSIKEISLGVDDGRIKRSDINEELIEKCFYTNQCKPVDLLIRTSGEVRLSDFLLWQTSFSTLCFVDALWPEFSVWNFLYCILKYQLEYDTMKNAKELSRVKEKRSQMENDLNHVCQQLHISRINEAKEMVDVAVKNYSEERYEREKNFLEYLADKRTKFYSQLVKSC